MEYQIGLSAEKNEAKKSWRQPDFNMEAVACNAKATKELYCEYNANNPLCLEEVSCAARCATSHEITKCMHECMPADLDEFCMHNPKHTVCSVKNTASLVESKLTDSPSSSSH